MHHPTMDDEPRPIRLLLSPPLSFGPGKAELLEKIAGTGSLQGAAAAMEMSYMKAWKMIKGLNTSFAEPLVVMQRGGKTQGGAELTKNGREVLALYQAAVKAAEKASAPMLKKMTKRLAADEANSSPKAR
jgi:molybdate transport system regulatory protein